MIDLHCHILPDFDDGAATLEVTLAMAREAVADGTTMMAATPHSPDSSAGKRYSVALVRERLAQVRAALEAEGIPLALVSGTELYYAGDLPERLRNGSLLPYGTSHTVLLECPPPELPQGLPDVIFGLQAAGYRVVLAHPERLRDVQRQPTLLAPLVERGVLMQVTAEALTGNQGAAIQATAEALLTQDLAHLLASDGHSVSPRRPVQLAQARARAAELLGQARANALVLDTPAALLNDQPIPLAHPARQARRWKLW